MGRYRLLLAYAVILGHVRGNLFGFYPGTVAVISFLLLSGFVITALIKKHYASVPRIAAFYWDRAARLAPQFYFYSFATLAAATTLGLKHTYMDGPPSARSTALQLLMVPLDFYRDFLPKMLIPQGWSLGLEALFYATFPFILILGLRLPAAILSGGVFLLAYSGFLDPDLWGYRYLPGTLFIFICGSWMTDRANDRHRVLPIWIGAVLLLIGTHVFPIDPQVRNVLLGLVVGIPAMMTLRNVASSRADDFAGALSYGVYLNHFLVMSLAAMIFPVGGFKGTILVSVISTAASAASCAFIERPFTILRRRWRKDAESSEPATTMDSAMGVGVLRAAGD